MLRKPWELSLLFYFQQLGDLCVCRPRHEPDMRGMRAVGRIVDVDAGRCGKKKEKRVSKTLRCFANQGKM